MLYDTTPDETKVLDDEELGDNTPESPDNPNEAQEGEQPQEGADQGLDFNKINDYLNKKPEDLDFNKINDELNSKYNPAGEEAGATTTAGENAGSAAAKTSGQEAASAGSEARAANAARTAAIHEAEKKAAIAAASQTIEAAAPVAAPAAAPIIPPLLMILGIILIIFFFIIIVLLIIFLLLNAKPEVTKEGPFTSPVGSEITYRMLVSYGGLAEDLIVEDPIPQGTTYVSSDPEAEIVYQDLDGDGAANEPVARWSFNDIQNPNFSLIIIDGKRSFYKERLSLTLLPSIDVAKVYNAASAYVVNPIGSEEPAVQGIHTTSKDICLTASSDPYCKFLNGKDNIVNFDSIRELIDTAKSKDSLNDLDSKAKNQLLSKFNNQSAILKTLANSQISYYHTPDVFLAEIKSGNIALAKQESVDWLLSQGFSQKGVCGLPIIFYLNSDVFKKSTHADQYFYPLAEGC